MADKASDPNDYPGMLYRTIGIQKLSPYRADFRSLSVAQHIFQPITAEHFHIIVHEEKNVTYRMPHSEIVHG